MQSPKETLVAVAKRFEGTHEVGGDNLGPQIEEFQRCVDKVASREPWCMCFVQYCVSETEAISGRRSRLYRSESVLATWNSSPLLGRRTYPLPGFVVLWRLRDSILGHCGIVTALHKDGVGIDTIEGNTSPGPRLERDGDGVYTKVVSDPDKRGKFLLLGYLDPFV